MATYTNSLELPGFFKLPTELRFQIYELIYQHHQYYRTTEDGQHLTWYHSFPHASTILAVNRQYLSEAVQHLADVSTIRFRRIRHLRYFLRSSLVAKTYFLPHLRHLSLYLRYEPMWRRDRLTASRGFAAVRPLRLNEACPNLRIFELKLSRDFFKEGDPGEKFPTDECSMYEILGLVQGLGSGMEVRVRFPTFVMQNGRSDPWELVEARRHEDEMERLREKVEELNNSRVNW